MIDPDAKAYLDVCTVTPKLGRAVHGFVVKLKQRGLWHSLVGLYPMIGSSPATNLRHPSRYPLSLIGDAAWTSTGVQTSGAGAVNTAISPKNIGMHTLDASIGIRGSFFVGRYSRVTPSANAAARDGCATGAHRLEINPRGAASTTVYYGDKSSTAPTASTWYAPGWHAAVRILNGNSRIQAGATQTAALLTSSIGDLPTDPFHFGASSQDGVLGGHWPCHYSIYMVGFGDTSLDWPNYRLIAEEFLVAAGRHLTIS